MAELDGNAKRLVIACRAIIEQSIPKLSQGLFEKLDDAFFQMAEKSESNSKQTEYLAAMRETRKNTSLVQQRFLNTLLQGYDTFWREGPVEPDEASKNLGLADAELSLVGEEDLEESLAVTSMASRGEGHFSKDLFALAQRFGHLLKIEHIDEKYLPLAPLAVSKGFRSAMEALPLTIDIKLVIFKLFEKEVIVYLGGVYDELNAILSRSGILPKLPQKLKRNPVSPVIKRERTGDSSGGVEGDDEGGVYDEGDSGAAVEFFDTLRQLLSTHGGRGGSGDPSGIQHPAVDTQGLLGALSSIQQGQPTVSHLSEGASLDDVREALLQGYAIGHGEEAHKSIGQAEEDVIDVISMLFEFILDDPALPDHLKVLLGKLQIPMLKVAIMDKEFFGKKSHPARKLLNGLAQASVSLDASIPKERDPLYQRIESTVKRILDEFDDDSAIFAELYQQFADYTQVEEKKSKVVEDRSTQAIKGKERLEGARGQVDQEIDRRLNSLNNPPDVLMSLFRGPWKDIMSLTLLRNGPDSDEWRMVLAQMDKVMWSVTPKSDPIERKRLLTEIPVIIKDLREGMVAISYDQRHTNKLFKALQAAHIACLRNEQPKSTGQCVLEDDSSFLMDSSTHTQWPQEDPANGRAVGEVESILQTADDKEPSSSLEASTPGEESSDLDSNEEEDVIEVINDSFHRTASETEVGTWFELRYPETEMQRVKLSWRSSMTDLCVFVNRKGMKVRELSVAELAKGLRDFHIRVVEEAGAPMLVDRAMQAMMDALKRSGELLDRK
jgi:hypothetical protein